MNISWFRRQLHYLRYTPLHPQWFAFRCEKLRHEQTGHLTHGRVLDIGCGRQSLRKFLKKSTEYISLDYPETGIKLYKARPCIFGDAINIPCRNETFDTVILLEVLEHLPDPATAIQEAKRVLRKGGLLIISTPFLYPIHDAPGDFQRWTQYGIERLVESSGLIVCDIHKIGSPIETGVLLFNVSLAWLALHAPLMVRLPFILLSIILIPLFNLAGFTLSYLCRLNIDSPFAIGYLLVAKESD